MPSSGDSTSNSELPRLEVGGGSSGSSVRPPGRGQVNDPIDALRELQFLLLRHPIAMQSAFSALVAEGRRYGDTPEGKAWREKLRASDLVQRGRVVWEVATLKMLEESPPDVLPSTYLDALVKASSDPEVEPLLAKLFELGEDDGTVDS